MPTDTYYGADCEARWGVMADKDTDPTTWEYLPFVSMTVNATEEQRDRPQIGLARANVLDPTEPITGFKRVGIDLVVDADARRLPRFLRMGLGAPVTTGPVSGIYTHTWKSGAKTLAYFALQLKTADDQWRVFRGLTIGTVNAKGGGENVRDHDIGLGLRGLERERVSSPLGSTPSTMITDSVMHRSIFMADGVAASNTLEANWTWDRGLIEDAFMSATAELSGLRPGPQSHSGSAKFRALAESFDDLQEAGTAFAAKIEMQGVTSTHLISFEHRQAKLSAAPVVVPLPGQQFERDFNWMGYQTSANEAGRIIVANNVASYAS